MTRPGAVPGQPEPVPASSDAGTEAASGGDGAQGRLYGMKAAEIWAFLQRQPPSFWFICLYLFLEYVRPQSIYPVLEGLPWTQAALALSVGSLVVEGKFFRRFNWIDGALLFFGGVVLASMVTAYRPAAAFGELKLIFSWFLIYYLITNLVDTENRFFVFMLSFLLYSLKMSQHATRSWLEAGFRFRSWGATGGPGWFHNSGEFAIQMTIFIPLAIYFILALRPYWKRWKTWAMWLLPASGVVGVLASSSRGGQLGVAAVVLLMAAKSRRKFRALAALALVAAASWVLMPEEQKQRFEAAGEDETSQTRLTYWEDGLEIMQRHPVLGIGYKNWLPYYRTHYSGGEGELPHNIFIEAGAELGYTGLLAFLLLIGLTFYMNHRTRRMAPRCRGDPDFFRYMAHGLDVALVGYLVSGFFVTVLYYPYFWINLAMTAALYNVARKQASRSAPRAPLRTTTGRRRVEVERRPQQPDRVRA